MAIQGSSHINKIEEEIILHAKMVAKGGAIAFAGRLTGMLLLFTFMALVSRLSGAGVLGYFSMILTFYMVMVRVGGLGLHASVLKYAGDAFGRGDLSFVKGFLHMGARVIMAVSIPSGVLFYILSSRIASFFSKPLFSSYVKAFGIFLPALVLFYFLTESFKALRRADLLVLLQSIGLYSLSIVIFLLLHRSGAGIISPGLAFFLAALFMAISAILIYKKIFSRTKGIHLSFSPFARVSLLLMASGLFYLFLTQMDVLMVGYFKSAEDVGIYSAASRASLFVGFGLNMVNYLFPPIVSSLFSSGKVREIESLGRRSARWAFTYALGLGLIYFSYPLKILGIFGRGFEGGRVPLMILTSTQILSVAIGSVGYVLSMTEHQGFFFRVTFLSVVLNFVGNLFLIPILGTTGAALATGFSLVFSKALELVRIRRKMGIWVCSYSVLKGFVLFAFFLLISILLRGINLWFSILALPLELAFILVLLTDRVDRKIFLSFIKSV